MGFLAELFSGGSSKLIDSVGNTLDKVITTKGEKLELENEIKKAEMNYGIEMGKLSLEEKKLAYGDFDSARERDIKIQSSEHATLLGKNIAPYLAIGATALCFALFFVIIFQRHMITNESKDIIIYVLGVLSGLLIQIFSFYFGASYKQPEQKKQ